MSISGSADDDQIQFNKVIDNHWSREQINAFIVYECRPVPFSRMIFLGDGDTDIPAMKMVTHQQGHAIAVYHPDTDKNEPTTVHTLFADGRVSFVAPADYRLNSPLDIIVKGVLGRMAR